MLVEDASITIQYERMVFAVFVPDCLGFQAPRRNDNNTSTVTNTFEGMKDFARTSTSTVEELSSKSMIQESHKHIQPIE